MSLVITTEPPSTVKCVKNSTACTYGTHYPNRIFVGYLPGKVTASALAHFFRSYGTVLEGKIVLDSFGRSRRFGFVTFANQEDVKNVLAQESIYYKGKKINVGPAIKKRNKEGSTSPVSIRKQSDCGKPDSTTDGDHKMKEEEKIVTVSPVNQRDSSDGEVEDTGNIWVKIDTNKTSKREKRKTRQSDHLLDPLPSVIQTYRAPYHFPTSTLNEDIIPYGNVYVHREQCVCVFPVPQHYFNRLWVSTDR